MKTVIVLLSFIAAAVAVPDECSWGESYWCSSLSRAKSCSAVKHCIDTVWSRQTLPEDPSEICQFCENIIDDVKNLLENKQTQAEIVQFLDSACSVIPIQSLAQDCQDTVNNDLPELMQMIAAQLDPAAVCAAIGLCSGFEDTVVHAAFVQTGSDDLDTDVTIEPVCTDCKKFFTDIQQYLESAAGQKALEKFLDDSICASLGSESQECQQLVSQYAPIVITLLSSELSPDSACALLQLCSSKQAVKFQLSKSFGLEPVCTDCKKFFTDIKTYLSTQQGQTALVTFIDDNVCAILGSEADECKALVAQYAPIVITLALNEVTPVIACDAIQVCSSSSLSPVVSMEPVCTDCKKFFTDITTFLATQQGQTAVVTAIDDTICAKLGSAASECDAMVKQYAPIIIQLAASELPAGTACMDLGLCSSRVPALSAANICKDCEKFIADIYMYLNSTEGQRKVKDYVDKNLCYPLGGLKDTCDALVDSYYNDIISFIASDYSPAMVCGLFQVCPGAKIATKDLSAARQSLRTSKLYDQSSKLADSEACTVCEEVFNAIRLIDENPYIQQQIETFLETQLCGRLSGQLAEVCNTTINTYWPEIMRLIYSELTPEVICADVGLCKNSTTVKSQSLMKDLVALRKSGPKMTKVTEGSTQCVLCTMLMKELDEMLDNNATESEIIAALDKVCSILPDTMHEACMDFINTYGPAVIALLEQELQPAEICAALGLCSTPPPVKKVTSTEMCTLCETVLMYVKSLLTENSTQAEIEAVLEKVCNFLPQQYTQECDAFITEYEPLIVKVITAEVTPEEVCTAMGLCTSAKVTQTDSKLLGTSECTWGPAYWCATKDNAKKCQAEEHCRRHVWNN